MVKVARTFLTWKMLKIAKKNASKDRFGAFWFVLSEKQHQMKLKSRTSKNWCRNRVNRDLLYQRERDIDLIIDSNILDIMIGLNAVIYQCVHVFAVWNYTLANTSLHPYVLSCVFSNFQYSWNCFDPLFNRSAFQYQHTILGSHAIFFVSVSSQHSFIWFLTTFSKPVNCWKTDSKWLILLNKCYFKVICDSKKSISTRADRCTSTQTNAQNIKSIDNKRPLRCSSPRNMQFFSVFLSLSGSVVFNHSRPFLFNFWKMMWCHLLNGEKLFVVLFGFRLFIWFGAAVAIDDMDAIDWNFNY